MSDEPIAIYCEPPDFEGLIDEDVLKRFEHSSVFYGDIINAQLIKTNKLLIEALEKNHEQ